MAPDLLRSKSRTKRSFVRNFAVEYYRSLEVPLFEVFVQPIGFELFGFAVDPQDSQELRKSLVCHSWSDVTYIDGAFAPAVGDPVMAKSSIGFKLAVDSATMSDGSTLRVNR